IPEAGRGRPSAGTTDGRRPQASPPKHGEEHEMSTEAEARGRRAGGREARRAARLHAVAEKVPFITRTLSPVEVLSEEGLELIEHNANTILEQMGIDFRDPEALATFRDAGADVDGERVRFPDGMARRLVQATAPKEFVQFAR